MRRDSLVAAAAGWVPSPPWWSAAEGLRNGPGLGLRLWPGEQASAEERHARF